MRFGRLPFELRPPTATYLSPHEACIGRGQRRGHVPVRLYKFHCPAVICHLTLGADVRLAIHPVTAEPSTAGRSQERNHKGGCCWRNFASDQRAHPRRASCVAIQCTQTPPKRAFVLPIRSQLQTSLGPIHQTPAEIATAFYPERMFHQDP